MHTKVMRLQLKFWLYILAYVYEFPDAALSKVIKLGLECNVPYIKYYKKLLIDYGDPSTCEDATKKDCMVNWKPKIIAASVDVDSKLGTYYRVNPLFQKFTTKDLNITENERILITRLRTGSHSLKIEIGRFSRILRE